MEYSKRSPFFCPFRFATIRQSGPWQKRIWQVFLLKWCKLRGTHNLIAVRFTAVLMGVVFLGTATFYGDVLWPNESPVLSQTQDLSLIQGNSIVASANLTEPLKPARKIKMVVTAYSSTVWQTDSTPFITASGDTVRDGIVANNLLPFGTQLRIPELYGNRVFTVEDRMHKRKGYYHLDIWFPNTAEAVNFGAKRAYIEVLES